MIQDASAKPEPLTSVQNGCAQGGHLPQQTARPGAAPDAGVNVVALMTWP